MTQTQAQFLKEINRHEALLKAMVKDNLVSDDMYNDINRRSQDLGCIDFEINEYGISIREIVAQFEYGDWVNLEGQDETFLFSDYVEHEHDGVTTTEAICYKLYDKIQDIEISPDMGNLYDSFLYHNDYANEVIGNVSFHNRNNESEDVLSDYNELLDILAYLESLKSLDALTIITKSLAIV